MGAWDGHPRLTVAAIAAGLTAVAAHGAATAQVNGELAAADEEARLTQEVKPVRTPVAIFGSLGVCIYVPASRHWLISYSPIHLT